MTTEDRKVLDADALNALDDEDFAYIDSKGDKHLPVNDAEHVRAALARFTQTLFEAAADKTAAAKKIVAAAKKFDVTVDPDSPVGQEAGMSKESKSADEETEPRSRRPRARRELSLQREMRRYHANDLEVRTGKPGDDGLVEVSGMVIRYGTPYEVQDFAGTFTETIHKGAAAPVLAGSPDIRFLFNHDGMPLARTGADASLDVEESDEGLMVRAKIDPRQSVANDLIVALERGTVTQMSVGMRVDPDGDHWSGEDANGLPDVRNIYRLADIFDTSAVTYPASTTTTLELAARMSDLPPEITVRTQKLWDLAREGRKGTITQAESDTLMHLIEQLHSVRDDSPTETLRANVDEFTAKMDEVEAAQAEDIALTEDEKTDLINRTLDLLAEFRSAPTKEDPAIAKMIGAAHGAVGAALAAQMKDPDNGDDPDDKAVWKHLSGAQDALTSALKAQGIDGTPDADDLNVDAGQYGDQGGNGGGSVPDNMDGTGSRSRNIDIDLALERLRRPL